MVFSSLMSGHIRFGMVALVSLLLGISLHAQEPTWGSKMFEVTEVNFGTVPKGLDTRVQLKIKNVYKEDIQVTNFTQSCGALSWNQGRLVNLPLTIPSASKQLIAVHFDTIRHTGQRQGWAAVELRDPVHDVTTQVRFPTSIQIRTDLGVQPGRAAFGTVELSKGAERKIEIRYTGQADWRITDAKTGHPDLTVTFNETERKEGLVSYELVVALKPEAAAGKIDDEIQISTNEANAAGFMVLVDGNVEPEIVATDLNFGTLHPGQTKTLNAVIRGKRPVEIVEISHKKQVVFQFQINQKTSSVHAIPITLTAPNAIGPFEEQLVVKIADRPEPIVIKARGKIVEQLNAQPR